MDISRILYLLKCRSIGKQLNKKIKFIKKYLIVQLL